MALSLRDRLRTLTVIELKKELKEQFSAIQTGVKEDLVERLACLIEREQARVTQAPGKKKDFTILVLPPIRLYCFPNQLIFFLQFWGYRFA